MNVSHLQSGTPSRNRSRSASKSPVRTASKIPPIVQYDDQGNLPNPVTFAGLAARAPDPDGEGQYPYTPDPDGEGQYPYIGDIQPQQSNVSSLEPVYNRDPHARYQNAYHGNRYQQIEESDDEDDEEERKMGFGLDPEEHTRRANNNSYPHNIYDDGANKKSKLKKDEDDISCVFSEEFSGMSLL